jgi:hypothetical protein
MTAKTTACIIGFISGAVLLLAVNNAIAQTVRVESYMHPKSETDRMFAQLYLKGAMDGLLAYETFVSKKKNGTPLFCLPPKLRSPMIRWRILCCVG